MKPTLPKRMCLGFSICVLIFCNSLNHAWAKGSMLFDENDPVAQIKWDELAKADQLPKSATIADDEEHGKVVKVVRSDQTPQLIELAKIANPKLSKRAFVLRGKVKFEGVEGEGFLETWTHFPEPKEGAYFSRTMAETGPMGKLRGDSPWKDFVLPFTFDDPEFPNPSKIQLNLFLPNEGAVWLTDLQLIEVEPNDMAKQISGGYGLITWPWPTFLIGLLALGGLAVGIGTAKWFILKSKQVQEIETRRMQALDIS